MASHVRGAGRAVLAAVMAASPSSHVTNTAIEPFLYAALPRTTDRLRDKPRAAADDRPVVHVVAGRVGPSIRHSDRQGDIITGKWAA